MKWVAGFLFLFLGGACVGDVPVHHHEQNFLELKEAQFIHTPSSKGNLLQLTFLGSTDELSHCRFFIIKNPSKENLQLSSEHSPLKRITQGREKNKVVLNLQGLLLGQEYGLYWDYPDKNLKLLQLFTMHPLQKILSHNLGLLKEPKIFVNQRLFIFTMQNSTEISPLFRVLLEDEGTLENVLPPQTKITFFKKTLQIVLPRSLPPHDSAWLKPGHRYRWRFYFSKENYFNEEIIQNFSTQIMGINGE